MCHHVEELGTTYVIGEERPLRSEVVAPADRIELGGEERLGDEAPVGDLASEVDGLVAEHEPPHR
jgi:hypothetical protein